MHMHAAPTGLGLKLALNVDMGHTRDPPPPHQPTHTHTTGEGGFPCNRCFEVGHTCIPAAGGKRRKRRSGKDNGDTAAALTPSFSPMDLAYLSSDPLVSLAFPLSVRIATGL